MEAKKHTPGPWKILTEGDEDSMICRTIVIDGKPRNLSEVAIVTTGSMTDETEEANAKLIASAPDLLSVLIKINSAIQSSNMKGTILHDEVRQAIKKATE